MDDSFSSNRSELTLDLRLVQEIIDRGIPVVSATGFLVQLTTIVIFTRPCFEPVFYDFLQSRSICNLFVCLIGMFNQRLPCQNRRTDYMRLKFDLYVVHFPLRAALLESAISDNLLILSRLVILYEWKDSLFDRLSKKINIQTG